MGNPFKSGHDPRRNTRGRGKGNVNLTDLVRRIAAEPTSPEDRRTKIEVIVRAVFHEAKLGDMKAVETIMERGWGKAIQPIESTGNGPLVTIIQETPRETPQAAP